MHLFGKDGENGHRRPSWFHRNFRRYGYGYGYGRNLFGNSSIDMATPEEKGFEEEVRTHIEEILLVKFQKTNVFSRTEKEGVEMTIRAQIKGHSKVIFDEACHRIDHDKRLQAEIENMTEREIQDVFMAEVGREAERIAVNEFEFDRNIDIDQFMKREKEVRGRIEKGEITREEAYEILREPIVVQKKNEKESQSQGYEEYYRYCNNRSRGQRGNSSRRGERGNSSRREQGENSSGQRRQRRNSSARASRDTNNRYARFRNGQRVPPEDMIKPEEKPKDEGTRETSRDEELVQ